MRGLLLNISVIALMAIAGTSLCLIAGWEWRTREMLVAASMSFIVSEFSLLPLFLVRRSNQFAVAQAGLAGSGIQLLLMGGIAGLLVLAKVGLREGFLFWLLAFYPALLIVNVLIVLRPFAR
ncbi:MAG TPA: hypothetical protein VHD56_09155 [Tepidisphaeraceae bacterium]|nr:hypothetical protein [Tepidisphaeraceae bacterium]